VDEAGTLFDPGSVIPAYAFQAAFAEKELDVSFDTVMKYMGRQKQRHIALLLKEPEILKQFKNKYNRTPDDSDVEALYLGFKEQLYPSATKTEEIDGVKEAALRLKETDIPLIMTTGYDRKMVDETRKKLPWVDDILATSFTSSDVENGRPAPDMIYKAMEFSGLEDPAYAVKVGDTNVDMQAPDNAQMPGIIVTSGSIVDEERAEAINSELGRKHLVLPSLVEVIVFTMDGTLADRIKDLN